MMDNFKGRAKTALMKAAFGRIIVVGAGMGGLAAAICLAASGHAVTVLESAPGPGGKMRTFPSASGPVDAGPTVLTLKPVFESLFALNGERLQDHLTLLAQDILARHWWPDGTRLDLTPDRGANAEAIRAAFGKAEAEAFLRFDARAEALYSAFDAPVMRAPRPDLAGILRATLSRPAIWPALLPGLTLTHWLGMQFRDPRLVQLFARYATYVGGIPDRSPAVLGLIWRAEAAGVWAVQGGMHRLALALHALAERMGVEFRFSTMATRIVRQSGRVSGVQMADGRTLPCAACLFNGDPAALVDGLMGDAAAHALPRTATHPRSLSAHVWHFAATPQGETAADLIHHNVFFTEDPQAEFGPIRQGAMPHAPTVYLCAEDRAAGPAMGRERFEIILNAPAGLAPQKDEAARCRMTTFDRLARFGLDFDPIPDPSNLTTPDLLARRFPASQGAIYGLSPQGPTATFRRPGPRTALPGLYLAGGGAHPGAGVPMATLSGKHAAEAILQDLTSGSMSAPTAMRGGMSTASRMTGRARSRS